MSSTQRGVSHHYTTRGLGERILAALAAAGKDVERLAVDDLAPVDEFHIRGRVGTEELARAAAVEPHHRLLDVGCGVGGTSRYLADTVGCSVTGIDLTEEYCQVATMLSERVGLAGRTEFRQGSALELPFDDAHFDVAWTEHVQMNIPDKGRFYGEIARVLKPGGQFAFHDIFAGPGAGFDFPVPWAGDASISHLCTVDELESVLSRSGLERVHWQDRTRESAEFFRGVVQRVRDEGWMTVSLQLLMGDDALTKFENVLSNLESDRLRVLEAVMTRAV